MPTTIRNSELLSALTRNASEAVGRADRNSNNMLTKKEQRSVAPEVRDDVAEFRKGKRRVYVSRFLSDFEARAGAAISAADVNGNGALSAAEQASLPAWLENNVAVVLGSTPAPSPEPTPTPAGEGVFGISGTVPASRVVVRTLLSRGLDTPTAMAVNPHDGALWIVNRGDDSSVVVDAVGRSNQRSVKYRDDSDHFMNNPMAIAFSKGRNEFATIQDTDNDYNGRAYGNNFMGPTVFSADRSIYDGGASSHLDMLHHSPDSVGIAAGEDSRSREYWVFNGDSGAIDRYFFHEPHELGGHDHSDGETFRYGAGSLKRIAGVPGHLALDERTGTLYIADTGNHRIARLDTRGDVSDATPIRGYHDETPLYRVGGARIESVTSSSAGLVAPSGLLLQKGKLVVGDYATGHVKVFTQDGELVGDLDTGLGANALTGLAASPDGTLLALDAKRDRLVEIEVRA